MQYLLVQYVIVKNVVKENVKQGVAATTSCVVIGLQRHEPFEQRIKNIQYGKNRVFYFMLNVLHAAMRI